MAVTLELKSDVEARVVEQAAWRGVRVKDFLEYVIEDSLSGGEGETFIKRWKSRKPRWMSLPTAQLSPKPRAALLMMAVRVSIKGKG